MTCAIIATVWVTTEVQRVKNTVHYHANFGIVINGERLDLSGDEYMEDIGACTAGAQQKPGDRVHLHENNMDTVHVHASGVTWGHLMTNLGFRFGTDFLVLNDGRILQDNDDVKLSFIVNGRLVRDPFIAQIRSEDRLLISYGASTQEELVAQYAELSDNAGEFNGSYDPGSCQTNVRQYPLILFLAGLFERTDHGH